MISTAAVDAAAESFSEGELPAVGTSRKIEYPAELSADERREHE
jgi:hypothetical protein